MEKSEEDLGRKPRRSGAVWAALALSAGLATAPVAALAEESSGTASGTGSYTSATTQKSGAQPQPQASDDDARGTVGQGATAQAGAQDTDSADCAGTQVSAKAPAPSSDKGTYEKAGLHAVTVTYVNQNGRQIAPSHKEALADGESYSVASPEVGGYELVDPTQATVAGTVAKGSGDVTVKVVYRSTMVTYKVVHERQVGPKSSEYRVSETEALQAPAGSRVTVTPKKYDNYTCATKDLTLDVTADGNATLVVKYDVIVPTYGVYFQTSGSYVAPITGQVGDAVTAPADPTRAGYEFAGWDTDGDGKANALPATIPDGDVTAKALWTPKDGATYLVKYWGEDKNGNGSYHLLKTDSLTGMTDSTTPTAAKLDTSGGAYQWYTYLREDPVKIAGDGSSVLNVYYDWRQVKVYFKAIKDGANNVKDCPDVIDPKTVKMYDRAQLPDEAAALAKYQESGGKLKYFDYWLDNAANLIINGVISPNPAGVYVEKDGSLWACALARFTDSEKSTHYSRSIRQTVDRSSYVPATHTPGVTYADGDFQKKSSSNNTTRYSLNYEGKGFRLVAWRVSTNVWDGADADTIKWGDWHAVTAKDADKNGRVETGRLTFTSANVFEFKYDRIPYDVTYYSNGQVVDKRTQPFGSTIDVSTPAGLTAPEGMVFGGWYANPDFSGDPVTSLTMPEGGVHLYARWKRPDVHVTFDSAGGTPVAAQTVEWGHKATEPARPTRAGYEFGGWYYFGGPGADAKPRLLRVAAASGTPAPFPFDLGLEGDVGLVAAWKSSETPTTYSVIHRTRDGRVLATWTGTGTVGQTLTVAALGEHDARRVGHDYVSASGITLDLSADASKNVYEFVYDDEPSFSYVVHLYDEKTGLPVAADVAFDSERALLDYLAPQIGGYHVLFGGRGYLSIREGGQELTFWYERNPEQPAAARTATNTAPKHMAKVSAKPEVPRTGDATSDALALGVGALGAGIALLGSKFRRRGDEE